MSRRREACDSAGIVLYSLFYALARLMIDVLIYRDRTDARLRAEVLVLRHKLRVLERQAGPPRWLMSAGFCPGHPGDPYCPAR